MKKVTPAASPDAYVAALDGWRHECVTALRRAVRAAAALQEVVKWGHLVYLANGPVLLIRAEESRVCSASGEDNDSWISSLASSQAASTRWPLWSCARG